MSASLVGSEMCIRDSIEKDRVAARDAVADKRRKLQLVNKQEQEITGKTCLLYTSDAADDM
eukprot:788362-Alexandrium_andersonii.AAC.1